MMADHKDEPGQILLFHGDNLKLPGLLPQKRFIQLLLWSTPYPGQRGFKINPDQYLNDWLPQRLQAFLPMMQETAVYAQVVKFKRTKKLGWKKSYFDRRVFDVARVLENHGMAILDVHPWDKLNSPPSGAHEAHDRDAYEFIFVGVLSDKYKRQPFFKPYAPTTVAKAKTGNMRQTDLFGSLGGGHSELNELGAASDNVFRISSSGDQDRPRAEGGSFPRELAQRLIFQYTDPGDWVFDPCAGVGTSGFEAIGGRCNFVGAEIKGNEYHHSVQWLNEAIDEAREIGAVAYQLREIEQ